ncbi:hypothetical protein [Azospirillum sp. A39]|uniref:hypothetical protein n=1 Tax=Azospirillum sp. A39 TaxID=3462279 RepID=UPI0040457155
MITRMLKFSSAAFICVGLWLCYAEAAAWNKIRVATPADLRAAREDCETVAALYGRLGKPAPLCDVPSTVRSPTNVAGLLPGLGVVALALVPLWMASVLDELTAIRRRTFPRPSVANPAAPAATHGLPESADPQ